jgi:hypothetical protein
MPVKFAKHSLENTGEQLREDLMPDKVSMNMYEVIRVKLNRDPNCYLERLVEENNFFIFQQNRLKKKRLTSLKMIEAPRYGSSFNHPQQYAELLKRDHNRIFNRNFLIFQKNLNFNL